MLRTSSSTDSSGSVAQFAIDYDGVDDGGGCKGFIQGFSKIAAPLTSMLKTSSSTTLSTSATQIAVEYDQVDGDGGKLVEKSSKVEKPQKPEKSQRSSVRRNVYQSTVPLCQQRTRASVKALTVF